MAEVLATMRTCPRTPSAYSLISASMRAISATRLRAWRDRASPAGVGVTPLVWRKSRVVPRRPSKSEIRRLTADGAIAFVSAAPAIDPCSTVLRKSLMVVRSNRMGDSLIYALIRNLGNKRTWPPVSTSGSESINAAASSSLFKSTPVEIPIFSKVKTRSSLAVFPDAPGAKGQPPNPAAAASKMRMPAL